ncbi:hypothetical protein [Halosimplex amylolyticum]
MTDYQLCSAHSRIEVVHAFMDADEVTRDKELCIFHEMLPSDRE